MIENERKPLSLFNGKYQFNGVAVVSLMRKKERFLKERISNGYIQYTLGGKGIYKGFLKHRLVWEYYKGAIPKGLQINHINGIKTDNRIENLELVTPKQNIHHSINVLGNNIRGERHGNSLLSVCRVLEIIDSDKTKENIVYFSKKFNVSEATVRDVFHGRRWTHIGGLFMLNSCNFIGRITRDPETKQVGETTVTKFSIACNEHWKDKKTGERKESVEFVNFEAWGKPGQIIQEYMKKGSLGYFSGSLKTTTSEKDGVKKYFTHVNVSEFKFLDSKSQTSVESQTTSVELPSGEIPF